ncbi:hypothetical protein D9M68_939830 [compost metagenome]
MNQATSLKSCAVRWIACISARMYLSDGFSSFVMKLNCDAPEATSLVNMPATSSGLMSLAPLPELTRQNTHL